MLDPADCGPACISLSQDVQGETFDYPVDFFKERSSYHKATKTRRIIKLKKQPN